MEGIDRHSTGTAAGQLSVEGTLLRAALLAGYGADARHLARRLAAVARPGEGRSCLEAGAPLQLTVDAPGPSGLRVGVRLGDGIRGGAIADLVPPARLCHLVEALEPMPAGTHASIGTWLFWSERRQSVFVDLRDPGPAAALERLRRVLSPEQEARLEDLALAEHGCRPWALRLEADDEGIARVHLHWLLGRHVAPEPVAEMIAPGRWERVVAVLGHLLRRPGASGRWTMVTPLDDRGAPALRVGNSGWTLVPEDDRKHRALGRLVSALGGDRQYAEALWSFCRGTADRGWRVGRACEVRVGEEGARARLFLTPQTRASAPSGGAEPAQEDATAGTSSSEPLSSSTGPSTAEPSSA